MNPYITISLTTSIIVRGSWHTNQGVYLVQMRRADAGTSVLARSIDEYLSYRVPLGKGVLSGYGGTTLRLRHDQDCDIAFTGVPLRAVHENRVVILQKPSFQPKLPGHWIQKRCFPLQGNTMTTQFVGPSRSRSRLSENGDHK